MKSGKFIPTGRQPGRRRGYLGDSRLAGARAGEKKTILVEISLTAPCYNWNMPNRTRGFYFPEVISLTKALFRPSKMTHRILRSRDKKKNQELSAN